MSKFLNSWQDMKI